jgi:WhiB family redox-sensing transcriptional regulator
MSARMGVAQWTELAVCTEVGTDLFYPEEGTSTAVAATAVCRSCEVRLTCLRDALTRPGEEGVWGGFSERARGRVTREHEAGKPLEDIIADDDARYYDRIEAAA